MNHTTGLIEAVYNYDTYSGERRSVPCIINLAHVRIIKPNDHGTVVHWADENRPAMLLTEDYDTFVARLFGPRQ